MSEATMGSNGASTELLQGRSVAVIGYGSQGHAHALNLRDSGADVVVGLYEGSSSADKARADGLEVASVADAAAGATVVSILIPDTIQRDVYEAKIEEHLNAGDTLVFAHGFNVHYGEIVAPEHTDVILIAPKSPGNRVR